MRVPKIYLDVCSYNRPFDAQSQMKIRLETEAKLYIQAGIRAKRYSMAWSYMLDYENDDNPYEERKKAVAEWKKLAGKHCASSDDVLQAGSKIMTYGIKAKDALHIACAIKSDCEYFITTDDGLTKKSVEGIRIINPIDFVRELEDHDENG